MVSLKERLIEILINNKLLTQEQLNQALETQKDKGGRLSDIIVELKFIQEDELAFALSQSLSFPLIDLKRIKIEPQVLKIIPAEVSRHYQIIPVAKIGEVITLAMADPLNIFAIDHVSALTGYKINPIIASGRDILEAIDLYYPDATGSVIDNLLKEMSTSSLELIKEEVQTLPTLQELNQLSQQVPVVKITNMLLEEAVKKKASDILVEPLQNKLRVRFRIDGILYEGPTPPFALHSSIVGRIKVISNLNIAEHRLPQDGRFKAKIQGKEIDFRVSILPSILGERVAIRILDKSAILLDIEKLGFSEYALTCLKKIAKVPHGMILVCGPTGSGKTTTLYSILKYIDTPEKNIITVEDPVEYQLKGINQVTVRPEIDLSFATALRSILRQDPNVIMIGEIRDYETADIAIKSALTGHLVLSTLHTTTSSGAIIRLINMGIEPYLISASLIGVVSQRLLRKVCAYCKEKYILKKEIREGLKLDLGNLEKIELFCGRGCPQCFNTGYSGRLGIAEVLLLTTPIRELILSRPQEHRIKQKARLEGMKTLREEGLEIALKGYTTLEEVLRVTVADE